MRKGWIAAVAAVVIALFAGWYFGSPRWTLHEMAAAARDRDADKLSAYIDYPAVRASLKSQFKSQLAAQAAKPQKDGFAAIGSMFAMAMVGPMIDKMVTPEMMRGAFAEAPEPGKGQPRGLDARNAVLERTGFDEFRLKPRDGKGGEFVFRRHGLGWMLSDIRLPDDLLGGGPGATG